MSISKVNTSDVVNTYKFILGRLPESKEQIKNRVGRMTVEELRRELLQSPEFESLYSQKNFALNIPKRTYIKTFLKPRLIWAKRFVKTHPLLFRLAEFILNFLPKRIANRLHNLQSDQSYAIVSHPIINETIQEIYDRLNTACTEIQERKR
jgi:hypothetical protein